VHLLAYHLGLPLAAAIRRAANSARRNPREDRPRLPENPLSRNLEAIALLGLLLYS